MGIGINRKQQNVDYCKQETQGRKRGRPRGAISAVGYRRGGVGGGDCSWRGGCTRTQAAAV